MDFSQVPFCIEAASEEDTLFLETLAKQLSENVHRISSKDRQWLHLSAVFACNFSNHLYSIAAELLEKNNLSLDLLKPLIQETAGKIQRHKPSAMQTGPAVRGDDATISSHLEKLKENPELAQLYTLFTNRIRPTDP